MRNHSFGYIDYFIVRVVSERETTHLLIYCTHIRCLSEAFKKHTICSGHLQLDMGLQKRVISMTLISVLPIHIISHKA